MPALVHERPPTTQVATSIKRPHSFDHYDESQAYFLHGSVEDRHDVVQSVEETLEEPERRTKRARVEAYLRSSTTTDDSSSPFGRADDPLMDKYSSLAKLQDQTRTSINPKVIRSYSSNIRYPSSHIPGRNYLQDRRLPSNSAVSMGHTRVATNSTNAWAGETVVVAQPRTRPSAFAERMARTAFSARATALDGADMFSETFEGIYTQEPEHEHRLESGLELEEVGDLANPGLLTESERVSTDSNPDLSVGKTKTEMEMALDECEDFLERWQDDLLEMNALIDQVSDNVSHRNAYGHDGSATSFREHIDGIPLEDCADDDDDGEDEDENGFDTITTNTDVPLDVETLLRSMIEQTFKLVEEIKDGGATLSLDLIVFERNLKNTSNESRAWNELESAEREMEIDSERDYDYDYDYAEVGSDQVGGEGEGHSIPIPNSSAEYDQQEDVEEQEGHSYLTPTRNTSRQHPRILTRNFEGHTGEIHYADLSRRYLDPRSGLYVNKAGDLEEGVRVLVTPFERGLIDDSSEDFEARLQETNLWLKLSSSNVKDANVGVDIKVGVDVGVKVEGGSDIFIESESEVEVEGDYASSFTPESEDYVGGYDADTDEGSRVGDGSSSVGSLDFDDMADFCSGLGEDLEMDSDSSSVGVVSEGFRISRVVGERGVLSVSRISSVEEGDDDNDEGSAVGFEGAAGTTNGYYDDRTPYHETVVNTITSADQELVHAHDREDNDNDNDNEPTGYGYRDESEDGCEEDYWDPFIASAYAFDYDYDHDHDYDYNYADADADANPPSLPRRHGDRFGLGYAAFMHAKASSLMEEADLNSLPPNPARDVYYGEEALDEEDGIGDVVDDDDYYDSLDEDGDGSYIEQQPTFRTRLLGSVEGQDDPRDARLDRRPALGALDGEEERERLKWAELSPLPYSMKGNVLPSKAAFKANRAPHTFESALDTEIVRYRTRSHGSSTSSFVYARRVKQVHAPKYKLGCEYVLGMGAEPLQPLRYRSAWDGDWEKGVDWD